MITLQDLFDEGSEQSERYLIINKSSLKLTPKADNTAESLFAAIILKASSQYLGYLTDENDNFVTDLNGSKITFDNRTLFLETRLTYYARYLSPGIIRDVFEFIKIEPDD
ncbi:MAG: hypothetical protein AAF915_26120 [Cyanobacteria bacterium P01_D01_bin.50]